MRSRFVMIALVTLLTVFPYKTHGQIASADETHQQQDKIGKVNIAEVMYSTRLGKKIMADVEKQFAARQKELAKQEAEVNHLERRLSDENARLSDKEREQLIGTITDKQKAFDANKEQFQEQRNQAVSKSAGNWESRSCKSFQIMSRQMAIRPC